MKRHRPRDVPFGQEPPRSHVPQGGPRGQRMFDHPRAHGSPVMDCKIPIHFSLQLGSLLSIAAFLDPTKPKPSTSRDKSYLPDREVDKVLRDNRSTKDMG